MISDMSILEVAMRFHADRYICGCGFPHMRIYFQYAEIRTSDSDICANGNAILNFHFLEPLPDLQRICAYEKQLHAHL